MADTQTTIGIKVTDNGSTNKLIKNAEDLAVSFDKAGKAAGRVGGSKALAAAFGQGAPTGALNPANPTGGAFTPAGYRGLQGATDAGSAARDFAKQSQGIDGLVRVYATFAANVFAVSAAFRALREAAGTENLVQGLDQIGAASGRNLGSLAKQLVQVTDGAINLREALTTVSQTSSAGLTNKQTLELAEVAKKASQALGISLPDAISRLSRGISKIEPELLDEIGIFTKIGGATEKYALSVGKSASALTDFERRQAFANAVLEEGLTKFGQVQLQANPYDKLAASIANLSTAGLTLINTVVGPVVKFLSESPTALFLVLAGIGKLLLGQAIPALRNFRENLLETATTSAAESKKIADSLATFQSAKAIAKFDQISQPLREAIKSNIEEVRTLVASTVKSGKLLEASKLADLDTTDINDRASKELAKRQTQLKNLSAANNAADASRIAALNTEIQNLARVNTLTEEIVKNRVLEQQEIAKLEKSDKPGIFSEEASRARIAAAAERRAVTLGLLAQASEDQKVKGTSTAFKELTDNVKKAIPDINSAGEKLGFVDTNLNRVARGAIVAKGSLLLIGGAINTALASLGPFIIAFQVLAVLYTLLAPSIFKATKEQEAFTAALNNSKSAAENAERTLASLKTRGGLAAGSIEGIVASSNALTQLKDTSEATLKSIEKFKEAAGFFDLAKNGLLKIFSSDVRSEFVKSLSSDVNSAIKLINIGPNAEVAKKKLADALRINTEDLLDSKKVEEAIDRVGVSASKNLVAAIKEVASEAERSSVRLQSFGASIDNAKKSYDEFLLSTANSNPLFKVGAALEELGQTMSTAVLGGIGDIDAAFGRLAKSPERLAFLGADFTSQFISIRKGFLDQSEAVGAYKARLVELEATLVKAQQAQKAAREEFFVSPRTRQDNEKKNAAAVAQAQLEVDVVNKNLKLLPTDQIVAARKLFTDGLNSAFTQGSKFIKDALGQASQQAAITISKANLDGLTGANLAKESLKVTQQEIGLQIQLVQTNIGLIRSQEQLTASINESNAREALAAGQNDSKTTPEQLARLVANVTAATFVSKQLSGSQSLLGNIDFSELADPLAASIAKSGLLGAQRGEAAQQATLIGLRAQSGAANIKGRKDIAVGEVEDRQKVLQQSQQILQLRQQELSALSNIAGATSSQVVNQQILLDTQILTNRQANENLDFDKRKIRAGTNAIELEKVKQEREALNAKQSKETAAQQISNQQKLLEVTFRRLDQEFKQQEANRDLEYQRSLVSLEIDSARIDGLKEVTNLEQGIVNELKFKNELDKLNNELGTQEVAIRGAQALEAEKLAVRKQAILDLIQKGVTSEAEAQPALAAINEELQRSLDLRNTALGVITVQGEKQLALLQINKDVADQQERFNSLLSSTASIGESLGNIFGDLGSKIAGAVDAFTKLAINTEKGQNALSALSSEYEKAFDSGNEKKAAEIGVQISKQTIRNQKDEIAGTAKVLGAAKGLFKEKTAGFKVLNAAEKASHAISIALELQTLGIKLSSVFQQVAAAIFGETAKTGATQTGFAARIPTYISEILLSWGAAVPIVGGILGAAFIAAVLGGGGGGSSGPSFIQTSEQRQQNQGTAQRFDENGNLVQTNRGVFGDVNAKSESIANSLEIIKDNSVRGLDFDNKMLNALESLVDALGNAAEDLYGIRGLRTGSLSGTVEGTNSGGGFLGIGGLFSKSTTKTIVDSGLQLRGTFLQLAQGVSGTTKLFETISTTVTKSGFLGFGGGSKTSVNTEFKELAGVDPKAAQSIRDAFSNGATILVEIGKLANVAETSVIDALGRTQVDELASLRGLTGEQFGEELSAVIGNILDQAAEAIFTDFLRFAKFGEGALETVIRVVDTNKKVLQTLSNIGLNISATTNIDRFFFAFENNVYGVVKRTMGVATDFFAVTQELAQAAGGLDVFIERAEFFADNFLSAEQRIAPVRTAVIKELQRLGLPTNLTKDAFRDLVQSLDLTTQSGRDTFTSLQNLQEGFVEVIEATEDAQRAINDKLIDSLQETAETVENTVSKFRDFAKTVKTFRDSLLISNTSVLTPADKYIEAKNQFDSTYALALAGDDRAISNLTNVAQSFLGISRDYFASSDAYTQDFNSVVALLDQAGSKATATADAAQLQLDGINTQIKLLETINANIATIAGVPMAASGGLRRGLTLVGELGPELVDFTTAGRVYTADQTAGMFSAPGGNSQQAVVSELRYLRQEVCALRKQQSTETGHLIQAAYDAQTQNAEQVTEGMRETAQTQARIAELQRSVTIS